MKIRRKVKNCLNCNALLDEVYNFCPMCGQENNDNNVSVGTLIHDFFSNYFAFDSKLYKSIVPFFIKPGYITNRYIEGKRVSYAHPLRMYLIISLFFFFIWSLIAKDLVQDTDSNDNSSNPVVQEDLSFDEAFKELDSAEISALRELLPTKTLSRVDSAMAENDNLEFMAAFRQNTSPAEKKLIAQNITKRVIDSTAATLAPDVDLKLPETNFADTSATDSTDNDEFVLFRLDYEQMNDIGKNLTLSDQEVLDSLNMENLSSTEKDLALQTIRVNRADKEALAGYVVKNLPIMMLVLIPMFALILKILYVRRKQYLYINHIIHALHLHSFAYLLYAITLIITHFMIDGEGPSNLINFISFVLVTTYCYVSFLRVYKQGWFKTLVKFNLTGYFYLSLISAFFMLELLISFYLY